MRLASDANTPINPLPREGIFVEGNMENISATIPFNISANPNVVENVNIGVKNFLLRRLRSIQPCLSNSETYFPGHMRRCQAYIHR